MKSPRLGWRWWAVAALWWTAEGLSSASQIHLMSREDSWTPALRVALASAWLWIPLTILAFWASDRFPFTRGRVLVPALAHVGGALFVSAVRALAVVVLNPWVGWYDAVPAWPRLYVTSLQNNVFLYLLLVGIGHAIHFARTSRLREEQLARVQLQALKAQLQPHFLFNALNTISSFVRDRPAMAERMIERLARLLRQTLDSGGTDEVTLARELETLQPYLDIEQARFEDRLSVHFDIDPETTSALVPHLLLQPLVENAVRHGLAPMAAPGVIDIAARRRDGELEIEVRDNGVGLPRDLAERRAAGLGLSNTAMRLERLYGARHRFDVAAATPRGTRVGIRIPFRPTEAP